MCGELRHIKRECPRTNRRVGVLTPSPISPSEKSRGQSRKKPVAAQGDEETMEWKDVYFGRKWDGGTQKGRGSEQAVKQSRQGLLK